MVNTYAGLIIPVTFNAFGIFLLRQFYLGIPTDLQEAAIMDGASYWGIYWNIMLPLSRPILSALSRSAMMRGRAARTSRAVIPGLIRGS